MADHDAPDPSLRRECRAYCRYLVGSDPTDYVVRKYVEFHRGRPRAAAFDRFLLAVSHAGTLGTRLADAYASRFARGNVVQRKLVLALALLECSPPAFEVLDRPRAGGVALAYPRLVASALVYGVSLVVATVLFAPVHVVAVLLGGPRGRRS